jgi:hypothetical protein
VPTVALPRWIVGLAVGALAVCLIAVAFLLGRVTAPPAAVTDAEVTEPAAPGGIEAEEPVAPAGGEGAPGALSPAEEASPEVDGEAPSTLAPDGDADRALAPAPPVGDRTDSRAVAAYFARMDAVAAQVKATQDPQALARTILDETLSGNMRGFEDLIATQRALQARMAEVLPPSACREHHERSLRLIGRAIALLERTRDAVAGKNTTVLAGIAPEGRAIEEEAKAVDALASELRRAAGLPPVP